MNNTTMNNTIIDDDDDQAYWVAYVNFLNKTVSRYGLGFVWVMGNIGAILTCIVFRQRPFRNSPCTMYFIASSLTLILTFNIALLTRILQFGYNVQTVNTAISFCKSRYYLFYIIVAVPRYNIILASIDRYLASSRNALRRQWSSQKIALRLILGNIVFWSVIYIQVIVFYEIEDGLCQMRKGIYAMFFSIYIIFDSGILPLLLMAIFGVLTLRNIHQITRRQKATPVVSGVTTSVPLQKLSKKDAHLSRMLVNEICLFIILDMFNPCFLAYQAFTLNTIKSPLRKAVETFLGNMSYGFIHLGFSLTFITFFISSQLFRKEFLRCIRVNIFRQSLPSETTTGGISTTANLAALRT